MNIIVCNECNTKSTIPVNLPSNTCPNCFSTNVIPDYDMHEDSLCEEESCEDVRQETNETPW